MWRVGIDTGGTFTDIVAVGEGEIRTAKVPSTPPRFEDGVLAAIERVGLRPRDIGLLAHGTTVTTNAVITKSGARTGLLTTRGFRDVLELRRHNRAELYDILWDPPEPLVSRQRRLEVTERIDYAGEVIVPLHEEEVRAALERLRDYGIDALAVCLLHSYQNPAHEERVREIALTLWPELYVSISSTLLREPQEFERTSTTVANAYVGPILAGYVSRLERRLEAEVFGGRLMIMHSGGGLLPVASALAVPARTVTSGPAAGAMAAEGFAVTGAPAPDAPRGGAPPAPRDDAGHLISLDIGGTSADIAVVRDGRVLLVNEYLPEFGLPIRFPAVDLMTIGAGGGSIAWVDAAGAPRVGPQSAGAVPGPACYDQGGNEATVTDAAVVLGRLTPETRLAGKLSLNPASAQAAVERFARQIGLDLHAAALGIIEIANSNMARAIRVMTVERGLDPRRFVLLPFGGAGPMHACELAEQLQMRDVLVPPTPGVTSALGTLCVDIVHDLARSSIALLEALNPTQVEVVFRELEEQARAALDGDGVPRDRQRLERFLDLRYVGQVKTLTIPLPAPVGQAVAAATLRQARRLFLTEYERRYHYVTDDIDVELSVIRVRGRGLQDGLAPRAVGPRDGSEPPAREPPARASMAPLTRRQVHFQGGSAETAVYRRDALGVGTALSGPLIVEQEDCTTVVPPGWSLSVEGSGSLRLSRA